MAKAGTNVQPIRKFAQFFKAYNVGLSLLVAAIPVLIGVWDLIPLYTNTKNYLTLITSVGSYLLVGFIFSRRTEVARLYFPGRGKTRVAYSRDVQISHLFGLIPAVLAALSLAFFYLYSYTLNQSVERIAYDYAAVPSADAPPRRANVCDQAQLVAGERRPITAELLAFGGAKVTIFCERRASSDNKPTLITYSIWFADEAVVRTILSSTGSPSIPYSLWMSLFFLMAFLCATSAFILMGLREYVQEELGLKDEELITSPVTSTIERRFDLEGAPGLFGVVEFSPVDPKLDPIVTGPFCSWHRMRPKASTFDAQGRVTSWIHVFKLDNKTVRQPCELQAQFTEAELTRRLEDGARQAIGEANMQGLAVADPSSTV